MPQIPPFQFWVSTWTSPICFQTTLSLMFWEKSHSIPSNYKPLSGISNNLISAWTKRNLRPFFKNPYHHLSVTHSCTEVPSLTWYFLCHICLGTISKPCCLCSLPRCNQLCFVSFNFLLLFFIAHTYCQSKTLMAETTVFPITLTSSCLNFTASPPDLYINSNSCLCMKNPLVEIPELFQFPVAVIIRSIYQILRSKGSIYSILCSKKFVNTTTEIRLANIKKVPRVIQVFFLCLSKIL